MANMLYNGVELPDIESVWTDKVTYPYAWIGYNDSSKSVIELKCFSAKGTYNGSSVYDCNGNTRMLLFTYDADSQSWNNRYNGTGRRELCYGFIWSNHDITDSGGTVTYLAASDPVPVTPPLPDLTPAEFLRWFSLGQAVRRGAVKEATMYSYNGVVLPKLPEWDREKYPYAFISHSPDETMLWIIQHTAYTTYNGYRCIVLPTNKAAGYLPGDGEWNYWGAVTSQLYASFEYVIWANFNVLSSDGSIYLAASEPTPVYE